jgi:hypothetical protein
MPVIVNDHHAVGHLRQGPQCRLDLTELDPETAQLHLVVGAPGELQLPVGRHRTTSPVRYIRSPGPPNGFATNRWRSARPVQVAPGEAEAATYSSPATPIGTGRNDRSST